MYRHFKIYWSSNLKHIWKIIGQSSLYENRKLDRRLCNIPFGASEFFFGSVNIYLQSLNDKNKIKFFVVIKNYFIDSSDERFQFVALSKCMSSRRKKVYFLYLELIRSVLSIFLWLQKQSINHLMIKLHRAKGLKNELWG